MFGLSPIVPAYGRTYNSLKAVQEDFDKNLDFRTPMGQYVNKAQLKEEMDSIQVRYGKELRKTGFVKCQ